ncbi:unnamed protein product [Arctia plantaginis]|uniref:Uncharacterized protein n=1 Tax=Arctia plantaginis TaxID=874455 RepID=A0A8S1BGY1_ARCPL|nr:unnamed protein product [Arctia plantaginis]
MITTGLFLLTQPFLERSRFECVQNKASTNLVGKFTQSVRRIVQDVKDEGTSSGQTKEEVIETNERLRGVRVRLDENYDTAKKALVTLMERYSDSKTQRNVFTRYAMLKAMIKSVPFSNLLVPPNPDDIAKEEEAFGQNVVLPLLSFGA